VLFLWKALVSAIARPDVSHVAGATVGVVFLGTPHRGSASTKWGEIIAFGAEQFGLGSDDRILKELREDSETLADLLYKFSLWLFRMSVSTECFYELHETDYGARFKAKWKQLVSILYYHWSNNLIFLRL
jgi:hypothetical protein